ncbi:MAG: M23 family metallopeptidase [Tannerellaceae bacterium]
MNLNIVYLSLLLASYGITSCSFQLLPSVNHKKEVEGKVRIQLPAYNIPLPVVSFDILGYKPHLAKAIPPRRPIEESFSHVEKTQIALSDPRLFNHGNTEIIDLSTLAPDGFAFPLPGAKVISHYGGKRGSHTGVDIKTCANDTIVAAFDGVVRMARPYAAYGNIIVIRHDNGLETLYSHNSKNFVIPGDYVYAGQPIALTGRTGRATTEHLHFETRVNGQHFNPNIIFNLGKRELHRKCLICIHKGGNVIVKSTDTLPHSLAQSKKRSK